jgi:Cu-processing system ATP-binding protein
MIRINALEKSYRELRVLKGVSLAIKKGEVTAIVGHNGAGKTTLIKSILGLVRPDGGEILIDEQPVRDQWDYRKRIGYMPQMARFPENLNLKELLAMIKDLRHDSFSTDHELFDLFALEKEMHKPLRTLSGGTRQKVAAVLAFLCSPEILILDEPTAGLDPVSSCGLKDKILKEKANGKTIILTSHIMSDLEELAENVVILVEGHVFYQGTIKEILSSGNENKLERAIAQMMKGIEVWAALQKL